ncbi:hypothetical protein [Algoriphagus taiwanensis]|uniref:Uncharacterized protein n=1 Tax=Algoriphagus taiwanensis TaxID=1445656 RepID=A0ABQ6Q0Y7_9BACT|nr:hypothetical protein Ataiwa_18090 [Algoriphagus taiwanensis]
MKALAVLISLLTLFLSTQTCCLGEEEACEKTVEYGEKCPEDSEEHLPCLPFFSCGACVGFTPSYFESSLSFFQALGSPIQLPTVTHEIPDFSPPGLIKPPSFLI